MSIGPQTSTILVVQIHHFQGVGGTFTFWPSSGHGAPQPKNGHGGSAFATLSLATNQGLLASHTKFKQVDVPQKGKSSMSFQAMAHQWATIGPHGGEPCEHSKKSRKVDRSSKPPNGCPWGPGG